MNKPNNKSSKICIYLPSFDRGGVSKITLNLINFFIYKKKKVVLITSNINKKLLIKSEYLEIITYKSNKKKFFSNFLNSFFSAILLFKNLKKNDKILSMQNHLFSIFISLIRQNKIIIRNSEEIIGATKYSDNIVNAFLVFIAKIIFYQFSYKIIALSRLSRQSLSKIIFNKKKIKMIYNPYLIKKEKFYKKKYNKNKTFNIISTGRLVKQKNFEMLINVIKKIAAENIQINLLIIGSGYKRNSLEKLIKNSKFIKIKSWKKNLKKYYKNANLFILSSLYEGSPNVLLDAINNSTPILASNCSGVADILQKDMKYIFKINDYYDLEKKLKNIINDYDMSVNKLKLIHKNLKRYSINNSKQYLKLIG